jgi:metal-responsive CopG/Arc/MetJ family transcriptional regulator
MARPRKDETMSTISVRLPNGLIAEIDRYAERLRTETRLMAISRADAIRHLLQEAIKRPVRRTRS